MARSVSLLVIALGIFAGLRFALRKRKLTVNQFFGIYFGTLLGIALLFLAVTGRLHPLFAILGAVLPFLSRLTGLVMQGAQVAALMRFFRGLGGSTGAGGGPAGPKASEISSRFLHMVLVHETGMMDGTVLEGQFKDRSLSDMNIDELRQLLTEVSVDTDSHNLLFAYLDREHEDWQSGHDHEPPSGSSSGEMTEQEALDILGLDDSASADDIIQAHRRMMQKVHPDRGGSTYLAMRINEAKEKLMELRG